LAELTRRTHRSIEENKMKKVAWIFAFLLMLAGSGIALARQSGNTNRRGVGPEIDMWVTATANNVIPAAEAMPEDKYSFAPTNGEFKDVRTFAEQIKHFSATNYMLGAAILGENPPHGEKNEAAPDSIKTKAEIMEYLKGSFEYLHRAAAAITDSNATELTPSPTKIIHTRPGLMMDTLLHAMDHYGQMVEYLRMNGIVPPSSRR